MKRTPQARVPGELIFGGGRNDMNKKYNGHCACGAVTYGFDTEPTFIANCHCTDCKRASGGEMATIALVPDTDFTVFSGKELLLRSEYRDMCGQGARSRLLCQLRF